MTRFHQFLLIGSFLPFCWLGMMAVHEFGHVVAGWASGGSVTKVVIHPLAISRTDVAPNPHPHIVVWAGPIIGVIMPLLVWWLLSMLNASLNYLARFFLGFCLIANGVYLGVGSFDGVGDAGEMLLHGAPIWSLWLFGMITIPLGFLCWNRLGPHFGLGSSEGRVVQKDAYLSLALLLVLLTLSVSLSSRV